MQGDQANATAAAAAAAPPSSLDWKFSQVFGGHGAGEQAKEGDIISAIEFNKSGHHLAAGDSGGRVVIFERSNTTARVGSRRDAERIDYSNSRHPEFRYMTEFKSHEPEMDYLTSKEYDEEINKVRWWQSANGALFLLSTNDKTIKFWKVREKKAKKILQMDPDSESSLNESFSRSTLSSGGLSNGGSSDVSSDPKSHTGSFPPGGVASIRLPVISRNESSLMATCRRVYGRAHVYRINSISCNSDGETFISADDLRINLWNVETNRQSFNIVDLKPEKAEDLDELITSAEFHPTHCNTLAYSSSKGLIRLVDLRQSALCDKHFKLFEEPEAPGSKSYFRDVIASISDIKFRKDGKYLLSRDYMTLKLWDINMDRGPVSTFQVHEYIRPDLFYLYQNDYLTDQFECCLSGNGQRVATGSYSLFRVFGTAEGSTEATFVEACKNPMRRRGQPPSRPSRSPVVRRGAQSRVLEADEDSINYMAKLQHLAWHPSENIIACSGADSLFMFYA